MPKPARGAAASTPAGAAAHTAAPATALLRAAPGFVQALTLDGRPYLMQDVEPYAQFWLSERERLLLALFARRGGAREDDAASAYLRLKGQAAGPDSARPAQANPKALAQERRRVAQAVAGMLQAGVLMRSGDDTSRYSRRIVRDYLAHRPFPAPVAQALVAAAGIAADTRVLDLAGGPGDLALALARHSRQVTLMELSRGFLAAARQRARQQGLALRTVHDSCNRLAQRDDAFDVITVSQALHWLDDVAVCRGVCRLLQAAGSFFVIHSAIELPDGHPLAYLLGHDSILGAKQRTPFAHEVQALQRRLALLFEALDAPDVDRIDPTQPRPATGRPLRRIGFAGALRFEQQRPFDAGYARGFLTPQHIAVTGQPARSFWAELDARCRAAAAPAAMLGTHHWVVLHFQRAGAGPAPLAARADPADPANPALCPVQHIGYEPAC